MHTHHHTHTHTHTHSGSPNSSQYVRRADTEFLTDLSQDTGVNFSVDMFTRERK